MALIRSGDEWPTVRISGSNSSSPWDENRLNQAPFVTPRSSQKIPGPTIAGPGMESLSQSNNPIAYSDKRKNTFFVCETWVRLETFPL